MSGENLNLPEIPDEEKARLERLDFDNAFSVVQAALNPILHRAITEKVGITKFIIGYDSSGEPLDEGIGYENTLEHVVPGRDGEKNRVFMVVRPGGAAIERYWGALDMYLDKEDLDLRSTARSTAHEMYACNLIVNAYMLAAQKEITGVGGYTENESTLATINMMLQSESARVSIRESDFEKKDELLRLIDPITSDPKETMRLNMHRLAAGIFYYEYKQGEPRVRQSITYAIRQELETDLVRDRLDDDTFMKKLGVFMLRSEDVEVLEKESNVEPDVVMNLSAINKTRAEKLDIDLIGWAFPMEPEEVTQLLQRF